MFKCILTLIILQIKKILLSFCSAKELRTHAETLPSGPRWLCETIPPKYPTKQPLQLFYHNPIECLQALLSHLLFDSHISFLLRKVWTCAAKICQIYDEWLSGDHAWSLQVTFSFSSGLTNDNTTFHSGSTPTRHHSPRGGFVI